MGDIALSSMALAAALKPEASSARRGSRALSHGRGGGSGCPTVVHATRKGDFVVEGDDGLSGDPAFSPRASAEYHRVMGPPNERLDVGNPRSEPHTLRLRNEKMFC